MDLILDSLLEGQWRTLFAVALLPVYAAIVNGLLVRMSKPDAVGWNVPARARPFVSLGLGLLYGVLSMVMGGATWKAAITQALVAGLLPVIAHQLGIEGLLGGKELPLPAFLRRSVSPASKIEVPVKIVGGLVWAFLLAGWVLLGSLFVGCSWWTPSKTAAAEHAVGDLAACAIDAYAADPHITPAGVVAKCAGLAIADGEKILLAETRRAPKPAAAGPCASASSSTGKP